MKQFVGEYQIPKSEPLNMALLAALPTLPLRSRYLASSFLSGRHRSPWKGQSVEFTEYRSYQQGDELRRIDWRYYARTDRLTVRVFEQDSQLRVYLVLDASKSMAYRSRDSLLTKMDFARTVLAALAMLARRQQDAVGLAIAGDELLSFLKHSSSPAQLQAIVSQLDWTPPASGLSFASVGDQLARLIPGRSLVIWAGDFYEDLDTISSTLQRLRYDRHDIIGLQILDPAEIDFDLDSDGIFYDVETGFGLPVSTESARASYLKAFGEYREKLQGLFQDHGCDFVSLRTDATPASALAAYLSKRDQMT